MYVKFLLFQLLLLAAMFFVFERFLMFYVFAGFFMFWIILVKLLATFGRTSKDIKGLCNQNKNNKSRGLSFNTISGYPGTLTLFWSLCHPMSPSFGHSATEWVCEKNHWIWMVLYFLGSDRDFPEIETAKNPDETAKNPDQTAKKKIQCFFNAVVPLEFGFQTRI